MACIVFMSDSLVIEHWRKSASAQIVKFPIGAQSVRACRLRHSEGQGFSPRRMNVLGNFVQRILRNPAPAHAAPSARPLPERMSNDVVSGVREWTHEGQEPTGRRRFAEGCD
jgi:hypothetical protein